jgi:hypothetical protein
MGGYSHFADCSESREHARAVVKHQANVSLVQEAMDRWRLQNDPAADSGPTMAEFVVAVLEQERRLS